MLDVSASVKKVLREPTVFAPGRPNGMRILPVALAISAAVHGIALGWAVTHGKPPTRHANLVEVAIATPRVEDPPIAIALLDDRGHDSASGKVGGTHTRLASSTMSTRSRPAFEVPPSTPPPETHSSLMTMRQPEFAVPRDFVEKLLARPPPVQPPEEPNPIEGERILDEIAATEHHLHDPSWIAQASPDEVRAARQSLVALFDARDAHELQRDGEGYKAEHRTFTAHVDPDGAVHFEDKPNVQLKTLFFGEFDTTDAIMRHIGQDPYASAKRKFLDDTRKERSEIGKRFKREQLAHSEELALQTLDWIWSATPDPRERKQAVFELWDDCAESGDADLVAGGRDAREMIATFVQSHLTGADAYTPDELAAFNAHKTSTATFAPYAP